MKTCGYEGSRWMLSAWLLVGVFLAVPDSSIAFAEAARLPPDCVPGVPGADPAQLTCDDKIEDSTFAWYLSFGSVCLTLAASVIGAYLLRRPAFLHAGVAGIAALLYLVARDQHAVQTLGIPDFGHDQLVELGTATIIGSHYCLALACLPRNALTGGVRKLLHVNAWIAFAAAAAAVFVLWPFGYALHFVVSFSALIAIVAVVAVRFGRGAWWLLGGILAVGCWGIAWISGATGLIVFPVAVRGVVAPVAISIGCLSSAMAIVVFLSDALSRSNIAQRDLRNQLDVQRRELDRAQKEAFQANESKYHILASVSHDLRQPMYAINLYISTLFLQMEDLRSKPAAQKDWSQVNKGLKDLEGSAQHLNIMFEALLDMSRLVSGNTNLKLKFVNIGRLLNRLEADYGQQASEQGLKFRLRLPERIAKIEINTDLVFLERILSNLIANALRYTHGGGVSLSLVDRTEYVEFRVVDTGPGIERALHERIFEEFYQVPGSRVAAARLHAEPDQLAAKGAGAHAERQVRVGLGLAISARLAESLGTRIRINSHPGKGSVFYFRQPMRLVMRAQNPSASDHMSLRASKLGRDKPLFIAVIDDDFEIRKSTARLLTVLLGAEVFLAESAEEAVAELGTAGRVPDLVISDFGLPGGDGIFAIETLRDEFIADIPAILVTGDNAAGNAEKFRAAGLKVLFKPVTGPKLAEAIEEVLADFRPGQPEDPGAALPESPGSGSTRLIP